MMKTVKVRAKPRLSVDDLFTASEQEERSTRLAAVVTSYGVGTKSYNRSGELRELKRQQAEATERYLANSHEPILLPLTCACLSYRFPHWPLAHSTLTHQGDWTPWQERYYFENKYNCWTEKTKKLRISDGGDGSGSGLQYWEGV
jgi:hypothetical protein